MDEHFRRTVFRARSCPSGSEQFDWDAPWLTGARVVQVGKIAKLPNGEPALQFWGFHADDTAPPLSANDLKRMAVERVISGVGPRPKMSESLETGTLVNRLYQAKVLCSNCGDRDTLTIPKGKEIRETACPGCGCCTLHRRSQS